MSFVPPGFAQVQIPLRHPAIAREAMVTFGIEVSGIPSPPSDLPDSIQSAFAGTLGTGMDSEVTIGPVIVRVGQDGGEPVVVEGSAAESASGGATQSEPANVALLFAKRTALGGRANRGRMYLPWALPDSVVNEGGFIDPAHTASFASVGITFLDTLETNGNAMVILHSEAGPAPAPVTQLIPANQVATQRRRLGR